MIKMNESHKKLAGILEKAHHEEILDGSEIAFLLSLTQKSQIDAVLGAAGELRFRHFGTVFFCTGSYISVRFVGTSAISAISEMPIRFRCATAGKHPKLSRPREAWPSREFI